MRNHRYSSILYSTAAVAALLLSVVTAAPPASAAAPAPAPTGFSSAFWSPYDDWSATDLTATFRQQRSLGIDTVIVAWSVHLDAGTTAYPADPALGYGTFNTVIPRLVAAANATGTKLWMGLVVAPDGYPAHATDSAWLTDFAQRNIRAADDLYKKYGSSIAGWYLPTEPSIDDVADPVRLAKYTSWVRTVTDYLHTRDGRKPVLLSPTMPTAIYREWTPTQFVQALAPMIAGARVDVWGLQDGFMMTAWTPEQEAAGFRTALKLTKAAGASLIAVVYTPVRNGDAIPVTVSQLTPYLSALSATGVGLSQWLFTDYFAHGPARYDDALRTTNTTEYTAWLKRR